MAAPSLALIPSAYKVGKVASVKPINGKGDFTFTRNSEATRINENGIIETMGVDVPRIDHTDGGCPSLLLEPASTNLQLFIRRILVLLIGIKMVQLYLLLRLFPQ